MTNKENIMDILKGIISNILYAFLILLGIGISTLFLKTNKIITLNVNINVLILGIIILFLIIIYFLKSYSRLHMYSGRENAMKANLRLLKKKEAKELENNYILSTRVSFWPSYLSENSTSRLEFRNLLTRKIENNVEVKRIWQIRSLDDVKSIELYLNKYQNHDNLSMRYLIGENPLPEILSMYGKVVSVSIPQPNDPLKLTTAFHFYGKKEIVRWEAYFNILWDIAIPIKTANKIDYEKIKILEGEFSGVNNT